MARTAATAHGHNDTGPGRQAASPAQIPMGGWKQVLWRIWTETGRDNISIIAAGCAFYALLALFPAITALVSIYGLIADPQTVQQQIGALQEVLPQEAFAIIQGQAQSVASGGSTVLSWSAALAILFALYTASTGIRTIFTALNIAYEEEETRGFIRFYVTSLLFTLLTVVGIAIGLGIIVILPNVLSYLPLGPLAGWVARIASWAVMFLMITLGLGLLYRFGPARSPASWRWLSPGSVVATVLWLAASLLFSLYAANFSSYNETYGTLGGVIILLMWLYISAFVVLLGAEFNAEIELQTAHDTTTGPERPMGKRGAFVADHTPDVPRDD